MKRLLILPCALLLLSGLWAAAPAYAGNITIFDGMATGPTGTWYNQGNNPGEDQEVEFNCQTYQIWDLEAFTLTMQNLSMVGGYNFKDGVQGYLGGDIFISTTGNALYGSSYNNAYPYNGGNGIHTVTNVFGYNSVIRMTFNQTPNPDGTYSGTYTIYNIGTDSLLSVYYAQNNGSNPWQLADTTGLTIAGSGSLSFQSGLTDSQSGGFLGGNHYMVTLADLPNYLLVNGALFHYTYECGNDDLMGRVPIPPTALLLGSGLVGLGFVRIRRRKARKV